MSKQYRDQASNQGNPPGMPQNQPPQYPQQGGYFPPPPGAQPPPGMPPTGQPPGWPPYGPPPQGPPSGQPPRKRHRIRNVVLSVVGVLVLIIVISAIASGSNKGGGKGANSQTTTATPSTPASIAPTFTATEQAYISDMRNAITFNNTTDSQIVTLGQKVCSDRSIEGQAKAEADVKTMLTNGAPANKITRISERDLCSKYLPPKPKPAVLTYSGTSNWTSPPFKVTSGTVTVTYSYSNNQDSNFIADITSQDQGDDQSISNTIGTQGGTTTTLYPTETGSAYHLDIIASGSWTVTITM